MRMSTKEEREDMSLQYACGKLEVLYYHLVGAQKQEWSKIYPTPVSFQRRLGVGVVTKSIVNIIVDLM